jgi:sugar transferase (PEP-CTERM/EpsH1 system associated)
MEDLLFLSHRIPYPPNKGDKIRSWHILKHLARGYRVHLGCLYDDPDDARHIPFLATVCATLYCRPVRPFSAKLRGLTGFLRNEPITLGYFHDRSLQDWVSETLRRQRPSRVFAFCSAMANYVRDDRSSLRVLDMIDLDSEKWRQYADAKWPPMKQLYAREHRLLLDFERSMATEFDATLFVSDAEAKRFAALAPAQSTNVHVLTNGVDLDYFEPLGSYASPFSGDGPFIVFTGAMDYWPNVQAVSWFARHVWPIVRRRWPHAEFWIVGRDPARTVRRLSGTGGIRVTGKVDDVRPYIAHASVVVAPLQTGCGVQNKVLEAMAMAKTVVATSLACEGLNVSAREDIVVAATPEDFAAAIASVVSREIAPLGNVARSTIERDYRWNFTLLDKLLDGTMRPVANAG